MRVFKKCYSSLILAVNPKTNFNVFQIRFIAKFVVSPRVRAVNQTGVRTSW